MSTIFLIAISILAGAFGNILIKIGSKNLPTVIDGTIVQKVLTNPSLVVGVLLMAAMFPFYTLALQRMSLSVAFPLITSSTFLVVALISYFFLKEPLTFVNILGILLLIAGLWLVAQR